MGANPLRKVAIAWASLAVGIGTFVILVAVAPEGNLNSDGLWNDLAIGYVGLFIVLMMVIVVLLTTLVGLVEYVASRRHKP